MSDLGSLQEFTETTPGDYLLVRSGGIDYKVSRQTLMSHMYPVDTIRTFTENVDPNEFMPGTWVELYISGGANLSCCAVGDAGIASGSNSVTAPLLRHTHNVTQTTLESAHTHTISQSTSSQVSKIFSTLDDPYGGNAPEGFFTTSANTSVEQDHTHSITISNSGNPNQKIDVSQKAVEVSTWKRTV